MSRDQDNVPSASGGASGDTGRDEWVQEQLAALRAALAAGQWPEGADRLLSEISARSAAGREGEDTDMLSLAINDALEGVDISKRYPHFYRRLLADLDLRQAFLDALAILESEDPSDWEAFPQLPLKEMGFLEEEVRQPLVDLAKEEWRIIWQQSVAHLQQILGINSEADTHFAWRAVRTSALEEESLPLLRDSVRVGERRVEVFLEATRPPGPGGQLEPSLIVVGIEETQPLRAVLRWGSYEESVTISPGDLAHLPPVPLAAIFDESGLTSLKLEIVGANL